MLESQRSLVRSTSSPQGSWSMRHRHGITTDGVRRLLTGHAWSVLTQQSYGQRL